MWSPWLLWGKGRGRGIHQKVIAVIRPEMMRLGPGGRDGSGEKRSDLGYVRKVENKSC